MVNLLCVFVNTQLGHKFERAVEIISAKDGVRPGMLDEDDVNLQDKTSQARPTLAK